MKRFPLVTIVSILISYCILVLVREPKDHENWVRILSSCLLMFPLAITSQLWFEAEQRPNFWRYISNLIVIGIGIGWYLLFTDQKDLSLIYLFFLLWIAAIASMVVVPFIKNISPTGFWVFNQELFMSSILGVFYSLLIALGIEAGIVAIEYLFDVKWYNEIYLDVLLLMLTLFSTFFLISNIPLSFVQSTEEFDYKKTYQIIVKFILIPLVILYFLILYSYGIKILLIWDLPKGWLGSLCLGFSSIGVLAYLLSHRMNDWDDSRLLYYYKKYFIASLIPVIALMTIALVHRIKDYGFTEDRYLVLIVTIWLFSLVLYHLLFRKSDLRYYPLSIGIGALLFSFGPQGINSLPLESQMSQLRSLAIEKNVMKNDHWLIGQTLPEKEYYRLSNILYYLQDRNALDPWIEKIEDSTIRQSILLVEDHSKVDKLLNYLSPKSLIQNAETKYIEYNPGLEQKFTLNLDSMQISDIHCFPISNYNESKLQNSFYINESEDDIIFITKNGEKKNLHFLDSISKYHPEYTNPERKETNESVIAIGFKYNQKDLNFTIVPRRYTIEKIGIKNKITQCNIWYIQYNN
ncbi:MAG: DUF4153 domain-containing protein [Saprospiraceae bacterium]|nr:DUF4153 domain-containing protein [Saprospiraceae bacterium]MBK9629792.1 DUF4153 domain-containing protein [Saprospiraceae bacterium]